MPQKQKQKGTSSGHFTKNECHQSCEGAFKLRFSGLTRGSSVVAHNFRSILKPLADCMIISNQSMIRRILELIGQRGLADVAQK